MISTSPLFDFLLSSQKIQSRFFSTFIYGQAHCAPKQILLCPIVGEPFGQRKNRRLGYPSYLLCSENNWFKALAPRRRRILTSPLHSGFQVNLLHVTLLKMTVSCSYYDILGVGRNASSGEIRAGYKKQSIALHPDKNPYGAELMKLVNEAYRPNKPRIIVIIII